MKFKKDEIIIFKNKDYQTYIGSTFIVEGYSGSYLKCKQLTTCHPDTERRIGQEVEVADYHFRKLTKLEKALK